MTGGGAAGRIESLHRYPVKSMQGESLAEAEVTERGIVGDRGYALVDKETGKVVSAKSPRKWARMFEFSAAYVTSPVAGQPLPPVRITLPDGESVTSGDTGADAKISTAIGREVTLVGTTPESPTFDHFWFDFQTPLGPKVENPEGESITALPLGFAAPGTMLDYSPLHLLTTGTLDRLREAYPEGEWDARRFRPNIVVTPAPGVAGYAEDAWIGHDLNIGNEVRVKVFDPMVRCVMTTLPQNDLPNDPKILRTVAKHHLVMFPLAGREAPSVGVAVSVSSGGTIRRGDEILLAE